jgi:benzodiazapine receptor
MGLLEKTMPLDHFPHSPAVDIGSPEAGLPADRLSAPLGAVPAWSLDSAGGAAIWIGLTLIAAAAGGLGSTEAPAFYAALRLPAWAPPAAVFGPVWSVLYGLMALSAWLVWRSRHTVNGATGLLLYGLALVPNALWSWLFFDWHLGLWALVDIALLWALVGFTVRAFWRVRPVFGALLLPLWAWLSFAGVLNAVVWRGNPGLLGG